jgi:hypothetical protein
LPETREKQAMAERTFQSWHPVLGLPSMEEAALYSERQ